MLSTWRKETVNQSIKSINWIDSERERECNANMNTNAVKNTQLNVAEGVPGHGAGGMFS